MCQKTFKHSHDLHNHQRTLTKEKPFVCPHDDCGQRFMVRSTLRKHVREKHDRVPYACNECDQSFATQMSLKYHRSTQHSTDRPFPCSECGKAFATQTLLYIHRRSTHRSERQRRAEEERRRKAMEGKENDEMS